MKNTQNTLPAAETLKDAAFLLTAAASVAKHGDTTSALKEITRALETIAQAQAELVAIMRGKGMTWFTVGDALGMTRQAAQQRFGGK